MVVRCLVMKKRLRLSHNRLLRWLRRESRINVSFSNRFRNDERRDELMYICETTQIKLSTFHLISRLASLFTSFAFYSDRQPRSSACLSSQLSSVATCSVISPPLMSSSMIFIQLPSDSPSSSPSLCCTRRPRRLRGRRSDYSISSPRLNSATLSFSPFSSYLSSFTCIFTSSFPTPSLCSSLHSSRIQLRQRLVQFES